MECQAGSVKSEVRSWKRNEEGGSAVTCPSKLSSDNFFLFHLVRAMTAAIIFSSALHVVTNNLASAMFAGGGQQVDSALEAIEIESLSPEDYLKTFWVVVPASITDSHRRLISSQANVKFENGLDQGQTVLRFLPGFSNDGSWEVNCGSFRGGAEGGDSLDAEAAGFIKLGSFEVNCLS